MVTASPYRLREYHAFDSAGTQFLYLVPSGAIFALDTKSAGRSSTASASRIVPGRKWSASCVSAAMRSRILSSP